MSNDMRPSEHAFFDGLGLLNCGADSRIAYDTTCRRHETVALRLFSRNAQGWSDMAALKNYWRRLSAGSAWGSTPNYDIPTEEMSSLDGDVLFSWQLGGDEFERLTADSFLKVGVCGTYSGALY